MNAPHDTSATRPPTPRAYLWTGLAALTCPCHVPILVAVLSGTAFGAFLSEHFGVALLVLTALFLVSAAAALRAWKSAEHGPEQP